MTRCGTISLLMLDQKVITVSIFLLLICGCFLSLLLQLATCLTFLLEIVSLGLASFLPQMFALLLRRMEQGDIDTHKFLQKNVPREMPLFFLDEAAGLPCTILDMSKLFGQGGGINGLLWLAGNMCWKTTWILILFSNFFGRGIIWQGG